MKIAMMMRLGVLVQALRKRGHILASNLESGRGAAKRVVGQKRDPAVKGTSR